MNFWDQNVSTIFFIHSEMFSYFYRQATIYACPSVHMKFKFLLPIVFDFFFATILHNFFHQSFFEIEENNFLRFETWRAWQNVAETFCIIWSSGSKPF